MAGELPKGWRRASLRDLVGLQRGHDLPTSSRRAGPVPVMGSAGRSGWHDESRAAGPGVVLGRSGASIGAVHFSSVNYWPLNTALYATDFKGNDPQFVYRSLQQLPLSSFNSGSAQPSLNRNYIAQVEVDIPPISEQRAIVSIVSALDNRIESNRRLVTTQVAARRCRFAHVYRGETERQPLSAIACQQKATVQPSVTPAETFQQFSIPAFDAGGDPEVCQGTSMASGKTPLPSEPVILVSKLNPRTPRIWNPVTSGAGRAVCSPEFLVLQPIGAATHAWLDGCVRHDDRFYGEVLAGVTGTTGSRQRVQPADVLRATVPAPGAARIQEWTAFAAPMIKRESALIRESRTLTAIRDALLPKLVSGRIRVPLADEPEEQLGVATEALGA